MEQRYWDSNGKYQNYVAELQARIPVEGSVKDPKKNPALERYRKAQNCYYDLYNNGLGNRAGEFAKVFELRSTLYRNRITGGFRHMLYFLTEQKMDAIILEAAREQGLLYNPGGAL